MDMHALSAQTMGGLYTHIATLPEHRENPDIGLSRRNFRNRRG